MKPSCINPGKRPCHSFENAGKRPPVDLCWEEDPREQTECTILLDSEGSVLKDSEGLILVHCEAEE